MKQTFFTCQSHICGVFHGRPKSSNPHSNLCLTPLSTYTCSTTPPHLPQFFGGTTRTVINSSTPLEKKDKIRLSRDDSFEWSQQDIWPLFAFYNNTSRLV